MRLACRSITRQPWHQTSVVAILAVAIGAGTAVISVARSLLTAPLGFADEGEVYEIATASRTG
jgi:hypothetical protein